MSVKDPKAAHHRLRTGLNQQFILSIGQRAPSVRMRDYSISFAERVAGHARKPDILVSNNMEQLVRD